MWGGCWISFTVVLGFVSVLQLLDSWVFRQASFEQVVSDTDLGTEEWIGQGYGAYAIVENCQYTNE